jgi:hypothetical protein
MSLSRHHLVLRNETTVVRRGSRNQNRDPERSSLEGKRITWAWISAGKLWFAEQASTGPSIPHGG